MFGNREATENVSASRILMQWNPPAGGVQQADRTSHEIQILMEKLPPELSQVLQESFAGRLLNLNEIYLQLGQRAEVVFSDPFTGKTTREFIGTVRCSDVHIDMFASFFLSDESNITQMKRKGIEHTLHRVSLVTHPARRPEKVIGVAVRIGRAMQGLIQTMLWENFLQELAHKKHSLLLVGRPGVGKTTVLREIAHILSDDMSLNVVVVDKTCEIAGDGNQPHPAIGKARWMPVGVPDLQHVIMREAVENQSPDVVIVDEISTSKEVDAARTIAQRGVMLIATVHGQTIPEILNCKERGSLVGGTKSVTISGREADLRSDKRKQVQKRALEPVFKAALELHTRSQWYMHEDIKPVVDSYFEGLAVEAQELVPGQSIAATAIPGEGTFHYCRDCQLECACRVHLESHLACPLATNSNDASFDNNTSRSNNSNSRTGGGGRGRGRGRGTKSNGAQGLCRRCGRPGHHARGCIT